MNNTQHSPIQTETKVALGMLALTLTIIIGGLSIFKKSIGVNGSDIGANISKYITTGLVLDKNKVSPKANPKIVGTTATYRGTSTTPIEITEFMDYECPSCASIGEPLVQQMLAMYGPRLTITRRIFPVHGEPAIRVARMVLASQDVSNEAYQKLHAKVFETQNQWAILGTAERVGFFKKITLDLGLDYDTLVKIGDSKYASQVEQDNADAHAFGIKGTPSFVINNTVRVAGGVPLQYITPYIDTN